MIIRLGLCALALLLPSFPVNGQQVSPMQRLNCTVEEILNCRFDEARIVVDSMNDDGPSGLYKAMLTLSIIGMRHLDYDLQDDTDSFEIAFKNARKYYNKYAAKNGVSSDLLTAEGFSYMIAAAYNMHDKNYLSGIGYGFKALSFCREAKKIAPSNADVDLPLGLYSYARADLRKKFWGIIFWYPGNKRVGIQAIEAVSKNGRFTSLLAKAVLQEIYIREEWFDKASEGLDRLCSLYPQSRFLLWSKAKLYDSIKLPLKTAEIYSQLAASYETIPSANRNYRQTLFFSAQQYLKAGNNQKAEESCRRLVSDCRDASKNYCAEARKLMETQLRRYPSTE
jgi:tetratricopeptide (TPR) repeat protein